MKKNIKVIVGIIIAFFILTFIFAIFAVKNKTYDKLFKNIYLNDINVSNMDKNEVKEILDIKNSEISQKVLIIYQNDEEIYKLNLSDFDYKIDIDKTYNKLFKLGRTENILKNNFFLLKQNFYKKNLGFEYEYDENKFNDILKNIDLMLYNRVQDDYFYVDNNKLFLESGHSGNSIDLNLEHDNILEAIENNKENYVLNIRNKENKKLKFEEVYKEVKKNPVDAKIEKINGKKKIVNEKDGYDIDIDLLKSKLEDLNGETIIELKVIKPNKKVEDLSHELYNEKIASFTTYFNSSIIPRSNNLKVGLEKLNGKIINSGEIFSFNNAIGEISKRNGYMDAPVFKGTSIVNEPGGGICQLSSTIYNTLLLSNFEIVERHNHGLPVGYVLPSRDATVYTGSLDLKMKNNRKYPVKIVTTFNETGSLNISTYGMKEEEEYDIELFSEVLSTKTFDTKYIYDNNLKENEKIVVNKGSEGKTSVLYLIKRLNGNEEKILISKDTYKPHDEVIKIGIKK